MMATTKVKIRNANGDTYSISSIRRVKPHANGRNTVGQQLPTLLDVTFSVRLQTLWHVVACCWELLRKVETGKTFSRTKQRQRNVQKNVLLVPSCLVFVKSPKTLTFIHFFSFNAIHLKFCNNIELTIAKKYVFSFFRFWHFWRKNDVTNFPPNFAFSIIGYLMMVSERTHHKDVKSETI